MSSSKRRKLTDAAAATPLHKLLAHEDLAPLVTQRLGIGDISRLSRTNKGMKRIMEEKGIVERAKEEALNHPLRLHIRIHRGYYEHPSDTYDEDPNDYPDDELHRGIIKKLKYYIKKLYDEELDSNWVEQGEDQSGRKIVRYKGLRRSNYTHISVLLDENGEFADIYTCFAFALVYYIESTVIDILTHFNDPEHYDVEE